MPRNVPVGNGNMLVAFDRNHTLREFYFPHVGEENHAKGEAFRFGVWVNGSFSWVGEGWKISQDYLDDSLVTNVEFVNEALRIKILVNDLVDFQENIYLKRIKVTSLAKEKLDARLFFGQDFHIFGNSIGDTALFRPQINSLLHYKGERYFLINIFANKKYGIDFYATGNKEGSERYEGTWRDAEDGQLSLNPIAQGSVDSVAAIHLRLDPGQEENCYYWILAGKSWEDVRLLNSFVVKYTPEAIFRRTYDYWRFWVDKEELNYELMPQALRKLYKRSLLIARTQIDNAGAIIAGNDSDVVYFNRDTYSYMWPRDGALAAYALDLAGYAEITGRFFDFCARTIEKEGYFLHKYTPSGMLASSWHPWIKGDKPQLPIQEDETALVIWALWNHFRIFKDIEFVKKLYHPLIKNAADFMMNYRDTRTGLPLASYDLWEERQGVFTFTCSAVFGGLVAAANFARVFGQEELARDYETGAQKMREAMDEYLYLETEKRFARSTTDPALDASLFGIFAFGVYKADSEKVANTMDQIYDRLWCKTKVGGLARYENDTYYRSRPDVPGNPWFVTTLWLAQYLIAKAKNKTELDKAQEVLEWVSTRALSSGCLAEQIDPHTNEPLSVSPLTWSHVTYIAAIQEYLNKYLDIEQCVICGQPKYSKRRIG